MLTSPGFPVLQQHSGYEASLSSLVIFSVLLALPGFYGRVVSAQVIHRNPWLPLTDFYRVVLPNLSLEHATT